ncbi:hypothetical protein ACOACQ_13970 [Nocardioides sp. CPCC 206347]|uniref:hypothetical protein n=2 Tax=Nocardioides TaxID=1839 RepID=UPI003B4295BB
MTQPPEQPNENPPYGQPGQPGQPQQWPVAPPPAGGYNPPPGGGYTPPPAGGYNPPPGGGYTPPPGGYAPPPGGYGAPSPYGQKPSGGSGKVIAIVVGVIVLLVLVVCGGAVGLLIWGANTVDDALDEFDPDRVGGSNNPITLEVGEEFEIDGVEYADGWSVASPKDEYTGETISGLKGTNDRADESGESVYLNFTFLDGDDTEVGEVNCTSSGDISHGNTEELSCTNYSRFTGSYDHVEVAASY